MFDQTRLIIEKLKELIGKKHGLTLLFGQLMDIGSTRHATRRALPVLMVLMAVGSYTATARASFLPFFGSDAEASAPLIYVDVQDSQTVSLLQAARNIDPTPSRGGGEVRSNEGALVADRTPFSAEGADQAVPAGPDQISLYLVQDGDTLSQVAEMFSVSVNTIVWANDLSSGKDIHPGQTLLILPINGIQHTVKKGDTLASIAKKYGGDKDEIIAFNDLAEGELTVGDSITIPGGEEPEEPKPTGVKKGTKVITSGPNVSGYFIHPLPGTVRTQGLHGYNGVDYGAPVGTPIRAAAGGRVITSRAGGWNGGYGTFIVIEHANGTQTLYAHNSRNIVWQGQSVVQGQVIGYSGNTGRSTGPHLHFEVRGARNPF
jgi:LysM repeat protein